MRTARLLGEGVCYYHAVSRIVDKRFVFEGIELNRFYKLMRKFEAFSGIKVITYCIMSNHVHLLLQVDHDAVVSDADVVRRIGCMYGENGSEALLKQVTRMRDSGNSKGAEVLLARYRHRMNNLATFMKELKQSFTMSFNKRHGRTGTLWESRFKSTVIQGSGAALSMTAAYIDLNPVRAGMVDDPKDYRYCGYGEAISGKKLAQSGLKVVVDAMNELTSKGWGAKAYRKYLFEEGITYEKGGTSREEFRAKAEKVIADGGKLSVAAMLHCKTRFFTDGVVLGSKEFVDGIFEKNKEKFGLKRKTGARPLKGVNSGGIRIMRALRKCPISPPEQLTPPS